MTYRSMVATGICSLLLMGVMFAHDIGALNGSSAPNARVAALPFAPIEGVDVASPISRVRSLVQLAAQPVTRRRATLRPAQPIIWAVPDHSQQRPLVMVVPMREVIILKTPAMS
ncbi:MAG: hypothetical protein ACP5M1_06520 [Acidiphilium sp.]